MPRTIPSGTVDAVQATRLAPISLVALSFASGTLRLWTGVGNFVWDGHTWTGAGVLGAISPIEETTELRAVGVSLQLTGVPADVLKIANDEDWQGRAVAIWFGAVDDTGALVGEPVQLFAGVMDTMTLEEGKTATIILTAESRQVDLERANTRRYTAEDQRAEYPGDRGCDAVAALQELEILWGG